MKPVRMQRKRKTRLGSVMRTCSGQRENIESKRLLGNFPQAYSHLALIETAVILSGAEISSDQEILDKIH